MGFLAQTIRRKENDKQAPQHIKHNLISHNQNIIGQNQNANRAPEQVEHN